MPTSRNRKKKKSIKKKKEPSLDQIKNTMKSKGTAPAPVKLKYFEASFEGSPELSFEEKLDALRKIGRDAAEAFPAKYQKLKDWFEKYDQPKLLGFAFYYFITALIPYIIIVSANVCLLSLEVTIPGFILISRLEYHLAKTVAYSKCGETYMSITY